MLRGRFRLGLGVFNAGVYLFLLAPIVVVVASSFGATDYLAFPPRGFSLRWYSEAITDLAYRQTFYNSMWLGLVSAATAVVVGGAAALALGRGNPRGRNLLATFFMSPLVLPTLVFAVALLVFSSQVWGLPGIWRLVVAHVVITIPYVLRTLLPVLEQLDAAVEDAASDLGASRLTVWRTVTLPIVAPAAVASALLAFMISFDEAVLALFLAPPDARTLPIQIYDDVQYGLDPAVAAVSTLLLVLTAVLMAAGQAAVGLRRLAPTSATAS